MSSQWMRLAAACTTLVFGLQVVVPPAALAHDFIQTGGAVPSTPDKPGLGGQPASQNPNSDDPEAQRDMDPVDLARGDFLLTRQDVALPGRGLSLNVTFTYRSRSAYNGPYGYGWECSYHRRIRKLANNNVILLRGSGRKEEFTFVAGAYTAPPGVYDTLSQQPDGTYLLTSKHGKRQHFDVNGLLTRIEDRHGNALIFAYDPAGSLPVTGASAYFVTLPSGVLVRDYRLTRITDTIGRTVDFAYGADGRLASLSYEGRTISYQYDQASQGDLLSVTTPATPAFPEGSTTRYTYTAHNLETITDPKGQTYLTNVYDSHDCLRQQTYGSGTATLAYEHSPACPTVEGLGDPGYRLTLKSLLTAPGNPVTVRWTAPAGATSTQDVVFFYPHGAATSLGGAVSTNGATQGAGVYTFVLPGLYEGRYRAGGVTTVATSNTITVAASPGPPVTEVTDRRGFRTRYTFDAAGHITQLEQLTDGIPAGEPASYVTTYEYDANGERTRIVYPRGNAIEFTYDAKGNLLETRRKQIGKPKGIADPTDLVTAFTYEPQFNLLKTVTDPRGNVTTYTYDYEFGEPAQGRLRRITYPIVDAVTPQATFTYNSFGQVETATDPSGHITQYSYDPITGYLTQVTQGAGTPEAAATQFAYDTVGNVTSITDAEGRTTTFAYNLLNQLTQATAPAPFNFKTHYTYDANGNLVQTDRQATTGVPGPRPLTGTTNPADDWQSTVYSYTVLDQLASVTDDLGQTTSFTYDASGNRATITDANGRTTTSDYDERNLLTAVTDAASLIPGVTEHRYDTNGNLTELRDAKGNPTTYVYDDFDRLLRTTYADTSVETYAYDPASNLLSRVTPATQTLTYTYDPLNRLRTKVTPEETTAYTYDPGSRLTGVSDADAALTYVYDALNRVTQVTTDPAGPLAPTTVSYTYDRVSNRLALATDFGLPTSDYAYDALNRLTAITQATTTIASFTYDALSRRTQLARANGTSTTYAYDAANRLTQLSGSPATANRQYTYDRVGNRLTQTDPAGLHTYGYDARSQLTSADYPAGFAFADTTFTYDQVGNRTQVVDGGTTIYAPNTVNQYVQVGTANLSYDPNGNLTNDGTRTYSYDSENHLFGVQSSGFGVTYTYDPLGRRLSKTVNGVTTRFLYDGDDLIGETDGAGTLQASYVFGPGIDEPIKMVRGGQTYYYHQDGLGSVVALSDATGALAESYTYNVYGNPTAPSALGNPYLFTGREYDPETGLYHYRARAYDSRLGRFLQRDIMTWGPDDPRIFAARNLESHLIWMAGLPGLAVHEGVSPFFSDVVQERVLRTGGVLPTLRNLYPYVTNNPVNLVDPFGLYSLMGGYPWGWGAPLGQTTGQSFGLPLGPGPVPGTEAGQKIAQGKPQGAQQPGILTAKKGGLGQKIKIWIIGLLASFFGEELPEDPRKKRPEPYRGGRPTQYYDPGKDPNRPNLPGL